MPVDGCPPGVGAAELPPLGVPPLRPAAVIHGAGSLHIDRLLDDFIRELAERGFAVGGVVQRNIGRIDDCAEVMMLVDVATGQAFDITQRLGSGSQACRVDPAGIVAAGGAVTAALGRGVDLMVINKFAGLEAGGDGLVDEMAAAIAAGVPLLTSVGSRFINEWQHFSGGMADLLPPEPAALWRWWGPQRLYADLVHGVAECAVRRIVVGSHWIAVETDDALGLTARAPETAGVAPDEKALAALAAGGLKALARLAVDSWDPLCAAIGMAAVNAHYNRSADGGSDANGLDAFAEYETEDAPLVIIGAFPQIAARRPRARIIDQHPEAGQYPPAAAQWLLPAAGAALITASTLANRTLPGLLTAAHGKPVALIGPGTPLTPRLFSYGVSRLSGFIPGDRAVIAGVIAAGGKSRDFLPLGRMVTLV